MDFPSRQTIHEVARVLNEWGITDFFKDTYNQNRNRFNIWCLELSKNTNLKVSNGCTKIVVKFGDDDWVIKIPYRTQTNYCHLEAENYALAHKAHLTNFFAPCYFYGVIDEIPIYLQRRVDKEDSTITSACWNYVYSINLQDEEETDEDYADRIGSYVDNDMSDYEVVEAIIGKNPELLDFIDENNINDLHKGNFGYLNDAPVIFDYSGF